MREIIFVLLVLTGCRNDKIPEGIIAKHKMSDILYDLSILAQYRNYDYEVLPKNNDLSLQKVLFENHNIDSLKFAKSVEYYSKKPKEFSEVYKKILEKLSRKKDQLSEENTNQKL